MPFGKRKKRPEISSPTNFEHRVHSGFDHNQGVFIGLPAQWNSIINETDQFKLQQNLSSLNQLVSLTNGISLENNHQQQQQQMIRSQVQRPKPIIDPSRITQSELTCFKTIVRGQQSSTASSTNGCNNSIANGSMSMTNSSQVKNHSLNNFNTPNISADLVHSTVANSNLLRQQNPQLNAAMSNNSPINNHSPYNNNNNNNNNRYQPVPKGVNNMIGQPSHFPTYPVQLSPVAETINQIQGNPNITKIVNGVNGMYSGGNQNVEYVYNVNGAAKSVTPNTNNLSGFSKIVYPPTTSLSSSSTSSSASSTSSVQQQQSVPVIHQSKPAQSVHISTNHGSSLKPIQDINGIGNATDPIVKRLPPPIPQSQNQILSRITNNTVTSPSHLSQYQQSPYNIQSNEQQQLNENNKRYSDGSNGILSNNSNNNRSVNSTPVKGQQSPYNKSVNQSPQNNTSSHQNSPSKQSELG